MDDQILLYIGGLQTVFSTDEGIVPAVTNVDLALSRAGTLAVVGESGCGKTVTALSILRLLPPSARVVAGQVIFNGHNLLQISEAEMREVRGRSISMIFQEPMTSLNPVYTIGDQVMEAILAHNRQSKREARERAIEMLHRVGIPSPSKRFSAYPHELSGGMRQRVMIAIALACGPLLLIADEPTTALDVTIQAQILELLRDLQAQSRMALLLITHDLGVVAEMAQNVAVMYAGEIVEQADVSSLFDNPHHPYTSALLSSIPTLSRSKNQPLNVISGTVPNPMRLPPGCRFAPRCPRATSVCWHQHPEIKQLGLQHLVRCWLYN